MIKLILLIVITKGYGMRWDSEMWKMAFVESSLLENKDFIKENNTLPSIFLCAAAASKTGWRSLFYMDGDQCLVLDPKYNYSMNPDGIDNPLKCWTNIDPKEHFCTTRPVLSCDNDCCVKAPFISSWTEARQFCLSIGMDLLTYHYIETSEQRNQIQSLFSTGYYWIGAFNTGPDSSTFSWIDGTPLNQYDSRWQPGKPETDEDFVIMSNGDYFDDYENDYTRAAICGYRV